MHTLKMQPLLVIMPNLFAVYARVVDGVTVLVRQQQSLELNTPTNKRKYSLQKLGSVIIESRKGAGALDGQTAVPTCYPKRASRTVIADILNPPHA
jgi:hypothetical protein